MRPHQPNGDFVSIPSEKRFWTFVNKTDTCWLWTGGTNQSGPRGYGRFCVRRGVHILAHRYAYELLVGPIPPGLQLDHVHARGCRSKLCVNPAHLEPVTNQENSRRRNALIVSCPRGHPLSGPNLYVTPKTNRRDCRECILRRSRERDARERHDHGDCKCDECVARAVAYYLGGEDE